jgi:hypothetical protein
MKDPTDVEVAWAAGFLEGEGGVYCAKRDVGGYIIRLEVTQSDLEVLERFQAIFGVGKIYPRRNLGPLGRRPMWGYMVQRREHVEWIVGHLRPWLSKRKRQQADAALGKLRGNQVA